MALPHEINEEAYSALTSEGVKAEYSKVGDAYFLQTSGLVPKAKVDEFRNNNIKLKTENEDLQKRADILGDMTQAEFLALKKKAEGGDLSEEEKAALIETEVGKRIVKLNETNEATVTDLRTKLSSSDSKLSKVLIDTELKSIGIAMGVKPEAVTDFITRGRSVFKMVDGKAVPMEGEDILFGKDGLTPLSMKDWSTGLASDAPHLFKESGGAGDRHKNNGNRGGAANNKVRGLGRMQQARAT